MYLLVNLKGGEWHYFSILVATLASLFNILILLIKKKVMKLLYPKI